MKYLMKKVVAFSTELFPIRPAIMQSGL